ncbi:MAG TPA: hypothetical protein VKB59_00670 [Micromonosporaceae bacterium]|nr:hypothetical protein [Micromonosporaceae bacterium]
MDTTDSTAGVHAQTGRVTPATRTLSHHRMVQRWRAGLVEPVSAEILSFVRFDGAWWRRTAGMWESVPDGSLAETLTAARARHADGAACAARGSRDPWTIARNRRRTGGCDQPPAFLPIRATDLRPFPPAVCPRGPAD